MDTPTYVIITGCIALFTIVFYARIGGISQFKKILVLIISSAAIFVTTTLLGEAIFAWAGNSTCSTYLGCVSGFFGYDAAEHFFFGAMAIWILVALCQKFPAYSILHTEFWKMALTLVAMVAFFSVLWEIFECGYDAFRISILHQQLLSFRLHIDYLAQPTNFDTMGDISFSLLGGLFALFSTRNILENESFRTPNNR